jgi:spore coat protein U-like protein
MRTLIFVKSFICQTCQSERSIPESTFARTSKRNALVIWFIISIFALIAQEARACIINVTGVNFGSYDVFSNVALHSAGNINMNCAIDVAYTMALSKGSGTYEQRVMSNGVHTLDYNLYAAANRAIVWGDATIGTATVSGSGTGIGVNHVVYGHIPALQNVYPGSYSDNIILVLTF